MHQAIQEGRIGLESIRRTSRPSALPPRHPESFSYDFSVSSSCDAVEPRGLVRAGYSAGMAIPSAGSHGLPPRLLPLPIPFRDQTQSWQRAAFNVLRVAMCSNISI